MYTLKIIPYLDKTTKCYKKIISINNIPCDELKNNVTRISPQKLSPFQYNTCCQAEQCIYVFKSLKNPCDIMCIDEIHNLFSHITNLGYKLNTDLNNLLMTNTNTMHDREFLCFITKN